MPTYLKVTDPVTNQSVIKRTNADGSESWIPEDPANSDYQDYLAQGGTP